MVNLKTRDEAARRRARRKYVRIILNDYVMNPGPSMAPIKSPDQPWRTTDGRRAGETIERFGLMASFVNAGHDGCRMALALGAGEHVKLPPGNGELIHILNRSRSSRPVENQ